MHTMPGPGGGGHGGPGGRGGFGGPGGFGHRPGGFGPRPGGFGPRPGGFGPRPGGFYHRPPMGMWYRPRRPYYYGGCMGCLMPILSIGILLAATLLLIF